jgi:hypothetical protein
MVGRAPKALAPPQNTHFVYFLDLKALILQTADKQ